MNGGVVHRASGPRPSASQHDDAGFRRREKTVAGETVRVIVGPAERRIAAAAIGSANDPRCASPSEISSRPRRKLRIMSTGKRLAKRSIIGTRVCAPGDDGKYYCGVIHAVKTPQPADSGQSVTAKTLYSVRFDSVPGGHPPSAEYSDRDLIGPGFGTVTSTRLVPGQKVYLTYNGREIHAEVTQHRQQLDEVDVVIAPNGQEGTMSLTKRIEEIRLLESRKSARLADQDTDFARLADMGSDRKRASSHSIDVPHVMGSRKRRPSTYNDSERASSGWSERMMRRFRDNDFMDDCTAALVLMSLSGSPQSPENLPPHCHQLYEYGSWGSSMIAGSPGVGGMSNSSSSSGASWRSGTPSPPLFEEGVPSRNSPCPATAHPSHNQPHYAYNASGTPGSTPGGTPIITLDEGIVPDYIEEQHPRKKIRAKVRQQDPIENGPSGAWDSEQANPAVVYKCTWPGCLEIKATVPLIEEHVRQSHLGPKKFEGPDSEKDYMRVPEEEFYYQEVGVDHMSSPPTMSHRDMARPPHEDPEYQKQLRLEATPATNNSVDSVMVGAREPNNAISQSPGTPVKHIKLSPRPLQACHQQNMTGSTGKMPSSPRRTRNDVKKCRKVYGMNSRELWCTQCRWKKACTRFCSE
ncbi:PREDICTED: zinc finger protein 395-like [Dinoponera quadriceps]|uniref:Zinc finger protein 395-like n=1 Tax=Dinoponera quadriceps TaxID=609295 RepID=A0A6P3XKM7_DINQU|nr:PREDICTED: zinc finger protein 395-like [Dinoponera quadriceps]